MTESQKKASKHWQEKAKESGLVRVNLMVSKEDVEQFKFLAATSRSGNLK